MTNIINFEQLKQSNSCQQSGSNNPPVIYGHPPVNAPPCVCVVIGCWCWCEQYEEKENKIINNNHHKPHCYFPYYCLDTIRRRSLTRICNLTRQRHLGGVCARHGGNEGVKTWVFHTPNSLKRKNFFFSTISFPFFFFFFFLSLFFFLFFFFLSLFHLIWN